MAGSIDWRSAEGPGTIRGMASTLALLIAVARTDRTFERYDGVPPLWRSKCLICNGFLEFTESERGAAREATIDHILSRANGGDARALDNLGIAHPRCNGEKGRNTDPLGPGHPKHDRVVEALLKKRRTRWRTPEP